ncbi:MAG: protoporphyrinogen oxidase [Ktedonobacterales bacterium]|nr:protoporphyrinogen oxidase [Ktedonobacterales bacterium]
MARILVLYGSTESQTAKIAEFLATVLKQHGQTVSVVDSEFIPGSFTLNDYDVALIGASMHAGGFQRAVQNFVGQQQASLNQMPSAFFSVSLTAAYPTPEGRSQLDSHLERFFAETGWHPQQVVNFAGALAYSQYHGLKRWAMLRIAHDVHAPTDTSHDYEYTDWEAVTRFAEAMLAVPLAQG